MSDDYFAKSEYYDDGVRFGTGPELITEVKSLRSDLSSARERIAEIEASLRAALKSHDKIPVNIPLPSWVESARSTLEGKQDADALATAAEQERATSAAIADLTAEFEKLKDPNAVHVNMLRGTIAKISMMQCAHTHGEEMIEAWRTARTLLEGKPDLPFGQNCLKCGALITENTCECGEA